MFITMFKQIHVNYVNKKTAAILVFDVPLWLYWLDRFLVFRKESDNWVTHVVFTLSDCWLCLLISYTHQIICMHTYSISHAVSANASQSPHLWLVVLFKLMWHISKFIRIRKAHMWCNFEGQVVLNVLVTFCILEYQKHWPVDYIQKGRGLYRATFFPVFKKKNIQNFLPYRCFILQTFLVCLNYDF